VARQADSNFAPYDDAVFLAGAGEKSGDVSNVINGTLKQSQKRTKRALDRRIDIERPGQHRGLVITMPTERLFMRANSTTMFFA
jgi:hypothetical protein